MNSPVVILQKFLPQELLDKVQSFMPPNDIVYQAIKKYYTRVRQRNELYNKFAYKQYLLDGCRIHKNYRSCKQNNIMCQHCQVMKEKFNGRTFWMAKFTEIFYQNIQFNKIIWYGTPKHRLPYHIRLS